ncbi:MAG: hypothetical protein AAFY42_08290 [Pseudomonadota bacterium]
MTHLWEALMAKVTEIPVPEGSLLAQFGPPPGLTAEPYRDCWSRTEPGEVTLEQFIERFYCSRTFRPERMLLGLIGRGGSSEDARRLARGEVQSFAAWNVVERRERELLMQDFSGATASWLSVEALEGSTRLMFGSWVGRADSPLVRALMPFHSWYSRVLLGGV